MIREDSQTKKDEMTPKPYSVTDLITVTENSGGFSGSLLL